MFLGPYAVAHDHVYLQMRLLFFIPGIAAVTSGFTIIEAIVGVSDFML